MPYLTELAQEINEMKWRVLKFLLPLNLNALETAHFFPLSAATRHLSFLFSYGYGTRSFFFSPFFSQPSSIYSSWRSKFFISLVKSCLMQLNVDYAGLDRIIRSDTHDVICVDSFLCQENVFILRHLLQT